MMEPTDPLARLIWAHRTLDSFTDECLEALEGLGATREYARSRPTLGSIFQIAVESGKQKAHQQAVSELAEKYDLSYEEVEALLAEISDRPSPDSVDSIIEQPPLQETIEPEVAPSIEVPLFMQDAISAIASITAADTLMFVVGDIAPASPNRSWMEFLRRMIITGQQSALCQSAFDTVHSLQSFRRDESAEHYLGRFTKRIIGLTEDHWPAVAQALSEENWRGKSRPAAYIRKAAKRVQVKSEISPKGPSGARALSLDEPDEQGTTLGEMVDDPLAHQVIVDMLTMHALEQELRRANLSVDVILFAQAKIDDISREEMPAHLGISSKRALAAEKQWQRKRDSIKSNIIG